MRYTVENTFHHTQATFVERPDGTISARTMRRVQRALCPSPTCLCDTSPASGYDVEWLSGFEPVYDGPRIVAYKVWHGDPNYID
jgi:hypothetical protein